MKKQQDDGFFIDFFKDGLILEPPANGGNPEESFRFLVGLVGIEIKRFPFEVENEHPLISFNHPNMIAFLYPKGEILILHPEFKDTIRLNVLKDFFEAITKRLN